MTILKIKHKVAMLLTLAAAFILLCANTSFLQHKAKEGSTKDVPVIMYHKISGNKSLFNKFCVSVDEFEQDLKFLKENGYETIFMSDLIRFTHEGIPLPEKPIVLTFDDGNFSLDKYALPLLEKYDMKIVASVIGAETEKYTAEAQKNGHKGYTPHLTWEQIGKLFDSGRVEIQNHSYDLHKGSGAKKRKGQSDEAYKEWLAADLQKLQDKLPEITKQRVTTFCYPFGAISSISDDVLKDIGFYASLSCEERVNTITVGNKDCLYSLGRYNRPHGKSLEQILRSIESTVEVFDGSDKYPTGFMPTEHTEDIASSSKGRKIPIYSVETDRKVAAITFDAAWGADDTDILLGILAEENIRATFFLCGYWVKNYPDEVRKMHDAGHDIANHGNTHANCTKLSLEQNKAEIQGAHDRVYELIGVDMDLFRAPYGAYNNALMDAASELGYYVIQWDVDSWDWMNKGIQFEISHVVNHKNLQNGSIILFHNDAKDTPEALPVIIKELKAKGYDFVPVSELIIREGYVIDETGRQKRNATEKEAISANQTNILLWG